MISEELIQRINELARKKKNEGLTPTELAEQQKLYKIYLAAIRQQVKSQLDASKIGPPDHVCDDSCCQHHEHSPGCNHKH